ncbi:hypothetical protein C8J56DRAFT_960588 [Mycena floridula]|nr:hypothetical protein C8J56DRAFT_960588 [Mycena floridula]
MSDLHISAFTEPMIAHGTVELDDGLFKQTITLQDVKYTVSDRTSQIQTKDVDHSRSESLSSSSPTLRQQQLREHSDDISTRIVELEGLVPRFHDAQAEIQRLRAELQWFRDQEYSDWALGLSDSPPPSYAEMGLTRTLRGSKP